MGNRIALSAREIGHNLDAAHCDDDADPRCRIICSNLGGCSNSDRSFEDSNSARIRARAARAGCLTAGTMGTPSTSLPFADNFDAIIHPPRVPDPARWTAADLAECQYKHLEIRIGRDDNSNQKGVGINQLFRRDPIGLPSQRRSGGPLEARFAATETSSGPVPLSYRSVTA